MVLVIAGVAMVVEDATGSFFDVGGSGGSVIEGDFDGVCGTLRSFR